MNDSLRDVVLDFLERLFRAFHPKLEDALENVAEMLRPQPPMSIRTLDDDVLTGVLVVDRGQVIAFIGTRTAKPHPFRHSHHSEFEDHDDDFFRPPRGPYER